MKKEKNITIEDANKELLETALYEAIEHKNNDSTNVIDTLLKGGNPTSDIGNKENNIKPKNTKKVEYNVDEEDLYINSLLDDEFISDDMDVPHDLIPLPSKGLIYKNIKSKIPVSYLTASDEDYISSPNLYLDGKIIDLLLNKKILDKNIDPINLCKGDRDAIIVWLRASGYGSEFPISVRDPITGEFFETEVDLSKLKFKEFNLKPDENGYFDFILPKTKHNIKFRFLTYKDELIYTKLLEKSNPKFKKIALTNSINSIREIVKNENDVNSKLKNELDRAIESLDEYVEEINTSEKNIHLNSVTYFLEKSIVSINGMSDKEYIRKYVSMMPAFDSMSIRKYINNNTPGIDFSITVEKPESLGGGSINTFLEFDYTIFLRI